MVGYKLPMLVPFNFVGGAFVSDDSRERERVRSKLDGNLLIRRESCRLKGDASLKLPRPRKDPCLWRSWGVACGLSMAYGL